MDRVFSLFANYEIQKLPAISPLAESISILGILMLAGFLWLERKATTPLDVTQTSQARGLAIVLVMAGHLWVHVVGASEALVLGAQAVSLFLMLSGYGLRLSLESTPLDAATFLKRRLLRVMLPYWMATVCILVLDYTLLEKTYPLSVVIATGSGVNLNETTWYIDYVRWYVTFLLLSYILFFLSYRWAGTQRGLMILFMMFFAIYLMRLKGLFPLGLYGQIFAFPMGCLLASWRERLVGFFSSSKNISAAVFFVLLGVFISYFLKNDEYTYYVYLNKVIAHASIVAFDILFACAILLIFLVVGRCGHVSVPFSFLGAVSYELFLLHGPLLIKYNPVFSFDVTRGLVAGFLIWICAVAMVAMGFRMVSTRVVRLLAG